MYIYVYISIYMYTRTRIYRGNQGRTHAPTPVTGPRELEMFELTFKWIIEPLLKFFNNDSLNILYFLTNKLVNRTLLHKIFRYLKDQFVFKKVFPVNSNELKKLLSTFYLRILFFMFKTIMLIRLGMFMQIHIFMNIILKNGTQAEVSFIR